MIGFIIGDTWVVLIDNGTGTQATKAIVGQVTLYVYTNKWNGSSCGSFLLNCNHATYFIHITHSAGLRC